MTEPEFQPEPQDEENMHIKTDFFAKTAKETSGSVMQRWPVRIVLVLILGLALYGGYQLLTWFMNYDKLSAMQNVTVNIMKPRDKDGIAIADLEVNNYNPAPIRNITIAYLISGADNSKLGEGKVTLSQAVPAGATRTFADVKLGSVSGTARRMHGELADIEYGPSPKISPEQSAQFVQAASVKDSESLEAFEHITADLPDFEPGYVGLGQAQNAVGKFEKAIETFKKAITMDPNDPAAHYGLAMAYLSDEDKDNARAELAIAAKLSPDDPAIKAALKELQ